MKKKTQKIIICISLVIMLFVNFGNVFGATNPDYTSTTPVSENALDSKIKSNILLDVLAGMVNAVASLAEYLIGSVFETLTGDNIFPWADRIIFNGIAFLDINFLNPADNSLFGSSSNPSILGEVVQQVYSTIFSLAVLFLGVAVGIMAIRLAISSIAAEKAKYKQAIVNWVTCIVMLFLMHYILAFVFWINEQMVRLASGILIQTVEDSGLNNIDFSVALNSALTPEKRLENFLSTCNDVTAERKATFESDLIITNDFLTSGDYLVDRLVYISDSSDEWQDNWGRFFGGEAENNKVAMYRLEKDVQDAINIKSNIERANSDIKSQGYYQSTNSKIWLNKDEYMKSQDFKNDMVDYLCYLYLLPTEQSNLKAILEANPQKKIKLEFSPNFWTASADSVDDVFSAIFSFGMSEMWDSVAYESFKNKCNSLTIDQLKNVMGSKAITEVANYRIKCDKYIWNVANGSTAQADTMDIIANLGNFFKKTAYVYNTKTTVDESGEETEEITGWRASKLSVTGALLYGIFIIQSCIYFIMYVKRLFYVIMLSMFGPIVVIYDFFIKSAG